MPMTLNANWIQAMRGDAQVRAYATIMWGTNAADKYEWSYNPGGGELFAGMPPFIRHVSPIARSVDLTGKQESVGQLDVELRRDSEVRGIVRDKILLGKQLSLRVGAVGLAKADYVLVWRGIIADIEPTRFGHVLHCTDLWNVLKNRKVTLAVQNQHPLTVLYQLLLAVFPAGMVDTAAFDPADARYSSIAHWTVTRWKDMAGEQAVSEPTEATDLIDELLELLQASISFDETFKISLVRADSTAAITRTFPAGSIRGLRQVGMANGPICTSVAVWWAWRGADSPVGFHRGLEGRYTFDDRPLAEVFDSVYDRARERRGSRFAWQQVYSHVDNGAEAATAYFDETGAVDINARRTRTIENRWLNCRGFLVANLGNGLGGPGTGQAGDTFQIRTLAWSGLGGYSRAGGGVPAGRQASGARTVAVKLDDEIIVCDLVTPDLSEGVWATTPDNVYEDPTIILPPSGTEYLPLLSTFRILTRGAHGTTQVAHNAWSPEDTWTSPLVYPDGYCWDATIPVKLANDILDRFATGLPIFEFESDLSQYGAFLRENVEFEDVQMPNYRGQDGVTLAAGLKWEVLSCEPDWLGSPPRIIWRVALNRTGQLTSSVKTSSTVPEQGSARATVLEPPTTMGRQYIDRGLAVSTGGAGGLNAKVAVGVIAGGERGGSRRGTRRIFTSIDNIALDANKDHYLSMGSHDGQTRVQFIAPGGAEPAAPPGCSRLAKLVTNGVAITVNTDRRQFSAQGFAAWRNPAFTIAFNAWNDIVFDTEEFDDGGTYAANTGEYEAPFPVRLRISAAVTLVVEDIGNELELAVWRQPAGGAYAVHKYLDRRRSAAAPQSMMLAGGVILDLARGDKVKLRVSHLTGAQNATGTTGQTRTHVTGERIY